MKTLKTIQFTLAAILLGATSSVRAESRGGGHDFEDGRAGQKTFKTNVIREAIHNATDGEKCDVDEVVRTVGAAMVDAPRAPEKLQVLDLTKDELVCWKKSLARIDELRKALGGAFQEASEQ